MVYPQLRAEWCTVSFDKINFNGRRTVMKLAKYYIGSCIITTQMPIYIHKTADDVAGLSRLYAATRTWLEELNIDL